MTSLEIIECDYCYNAWAVSCRDGKEIYSSKIRKYSGKRCIDIFHAHDTYANGSLPFEAMKMSEGNKACGEPCLDITHTLSLMVQKAITENKTVLVPGGYCNYAPAIIGGIQQALPAARIGVVWIDAHSDNHIAEQYTQPVRLVGIPSGNKKAVHMHSHLISPDTTLTAFVNTWY